MDLRAKIINLLRSKMFHMRFSLLLVILFLLSPALLWSQNRGVAQVSNLPAEIDGTYYALIIGNNDYQNWNPLKTAVRDAEQLRDVLVRRYTFEPEHVLLLKNASRVDMLKGFDWLKDRSKSKDRVLVYYGGHGEFDDREDGYWVPVDGSTDNRYSHISNSDVLNQLRAIDARHKLLVSDSCFSGNLLTRGAVTPPATGWNNERYFKEKNRLNAVMGFTSGGNEPVSDGGARWGGNSIFAYHLLAQLEANEQPYLTASELSLRITRNVSNDTISATGSQQTPVFQAIANQGHQGGEFFFIRNPETVSNILIAYLSSNSEFSVVESSSRKIIEENMLGSRRDIQSTSISDAEDLRRQMIRAGVQSALVWRLDGRSEQTASLLWQGVSLMDVKLEYYQMRGSKLELIDQYALLGERMPYRAKPQSPKEWEEQYLKVANKITEHWKDNGLGTFLSKVMN
jgi:hypothetical protein